jgi:hypothetical protein
MKNTSLTQSNQESSPPKGGSWLSRFFNWNQKVSLDPAHHDAILKNLDHRIQVAQSKGDKDLLNLLEAERQQLV